MSEAAIPRVDYIPGEGVGSLVLANPARLNAMSAAMWADIPKRVAEAEADVAVRVIVVRGDGDTAFSAGADISEFAESRTGAAARHYNELNHAAFSALQNATKPTIAMIHGPCLGGGLAIAACCDLRIADDAATFAIPAARLGIGYDPRWVRQLLAILPPPRVKEILFTARRIPAAEAAEMGLVHRVVAKAELESAVATFAAEIAANAPLTIRAAKIAVDALARDPATADLEDLDQAVKACFDSEDYAEGCRAFLEKRRPVFRGT